MSGDEKVVDYAHFDPVGDEELSDEDIVREASKLTSELVGKYRPIACLAILKISKKYVDHVIANTVGEDLLELFNDAADDLLEKTTIKPVDVEGSG